MSQENVELARHLFDYGNEHDGDPDWELLADDVQIVNLPDAPWQPSPGIKGMHEWLAFTREIASEFSVEADEIEDLGGEFVLVSARLRMKFRATGIEDEGAMVYLCQLVEGKLVRLEAYYTREQALAADGLS